MPPIYLLDIEGTVCPVTFVHDRLFPYFVERVLQVLAEHFPPEGEDEWAAALRLFAPEWRDLREHLEHHIKDLVARDVKDPALKTLQGLVWRAGYADGLVVAPLYPDAVQQIVAWSKRAKVYIYSSGSIAAQKLLFAHVALDNGSIDLTPYLSGYFDTTTAGSKLEAELYTRIASTIGADAKDILFLSDATKEVDAAVAAGMESMHVVRLGLRPSFHHAGITSFLGL